MRKLIQILVPGVPKCTKITQLRNGQVATCVTAGGTGVVLGRNVCQAQKPSGGALNARNKKNVVLLRIMISTLITLAPYILQPIVALHYHYADLLLL